MGSWEMFFMPARDKGPKTAMVQWKEWVKATTNNTMLVTRC